MKNTVRTKSANKFSATKSATKQRGYYYSNANQQKRALASRAKQSQPEKTLPTPIKLKWDNDLELFNKNSNLIQWIEHEKIKFNFLLNVFKELNETISDIIVKKKIKVFSVDKRIQNEKLRKEQEEYQFQKDLSSRIDSALQKANQALEGIRHIGNQDLSLPSIPATPGTPALPKPKEKNEIEDLIEKCKDKYNEKIDINTNNLNKYFFALTKNRSSFKTIREKNRRLKQKSKNFGAIFDDIYQKNCSTKNKMDIEENEEEIIRGVENENMIVKVSSILCSDLFMKVYLKVLFTKEEEINEEAIYNCFSLWFMINYMNNLFQDKKPQVDLGLQVTETFKAKNNLESFFTYSERDFVNKYIIETISSFVEYLNKKDMGKDPGVNEEDLFNNDFYKLFVNLSRVEMIKCFSFISSQIGDGTTVSSGGKEELNYFKNIQSIFKNNGWFCCNICPKKEASFA